MKRETEHGVDKSSIIGVVLEGEGERKVGMGVRERKEEKRMGESYEHKLLGTVRWLTLIGGYSGRTQVK